MPFGIEIALECAPRLALGGEELYRAVGLHRLAKEIRARSEAAGLDDAVALRRTESASGEVGEERLDAADLERQAQPLDPLERYCAGCPASVTGEPFGCCLVLSFPISRRAEEWLAKLVPPPDTLCGQLFRRSAELMNYGRCDALDRWRSAGFFESAEPAEHDGVTSDMVLHALFMSGDLPPHQSLALSMALGRLVTEDGTADDALRAIEALQTDPAAREKPLNLELDLSDGGAEDQGIAELQAIFAGLFRAFSSGATVRMRPGG